MLNEREAPTLLILHGLLSAGADPSEKTIDTAIAGAALFTAKLEALSEKPKRERWYEQDERAGIQDESERVTSPRAPDDIPF